MGALLMAATGCQKTVKAVPAELTPLQQLVNTDTTLTIFHRMLLQGNNAGLLADDSVTLLIPRNAAFRAAGFTDVGVDSMSNAAADYMVRYQYIRSPVHPTAAYGSYNTQLGYFIYTLKDSSGLAWFNGTPATGGPAQVGSASVYYLSAPLPLTFDSLPGLLGADSSLSFLAEVFRRTNIYDSLLLSGSYTLLAPVNDAFRQAGYDSLGAIDSADIHGLFQLAEGQVQKGIFFTNSMLAASPLSSLSGGTVTVTDPGGQLHFAGAGNAAPAVLLSGNQMAGGSISVHRISQVLSP
jgi:hypothetical protein